MTAMYSIAMGCTCALLERQLKLDSSHPLYQYSSCLVQTKQLASKALQRAYRVDQYSCECYDEHILKQNKF
jgi:hypothetical protein